MTLAPRFPLSLLLVLLLVFAGCGDGEKPGRVLLLGLDGLDPQTVDLLMAEGKMPNFARLRQEGAYGRVACPEPLLSPILWTTIATGKSAADHGIGHFVAVDPESGEELPATSDLRRVEALWTMAAAAGREPAVVGWWATWPPEDVGDGWIVSDHVAYHFLFEQGLAANSSDPDKTHPPELLERIEPLLVRPEELGPEELAPFVDVAPGEIAGEIDFEDELGHFRWALATAQSYRDVGLELWNEERPDLEMVYIEGTDSTSHLFGHLFRTEGLVGDLAAQQRRFGSTVEAMYRFADDLVGRYLNAADEETTVVVVSDHGFELGALHDDPQRAQDLRRVSERFHRDHGILYLWGHRIRPGGGLEAPHLLDVTPTVLALLGLPVGEDMPGRVLSEAMIGEPEVERVATWEKNGPQSPADGPREGPRDAATDQAVLEHLRGLGYLGGGESGDARSAAEPSSAAERNLAASLFQEGRYPEAAEAYRELIERDPEEPALRTSLAGVLGALGRYDAALEQLELALAMDPLHVEAYHNRAVIEERRGRLEAAIADYSRAVRYRPDYEPSRRALERLVGTANVHGPKSQAEARAAVLAQEASQAARRGDYPSARALLDEAAEIAPDFALVWQYRANVAYLEGDREAAIAALEHGLELEPDNELFRINLERLRGRKGEPARRCGD